MPGSKGETAGLWGYFQGERLMNGLLQPFESFWQMVEWVRSTLGLHTSVLTNVRTLVHWLTDLNATCPGTDCLHWDRWPHITLRCSHVTSSTAKHNNWQTFSLCLPLWTCLTSYKHSNMLLVDSCSCDSFNSSEKVFLKGFWRCVWRTFDHSFRSACVRSDTDVGWASLHQALHFTPGQASAVLPATAKFRLVHWFARQRGRFCYYSELIFTALKAWVTITASNTLDCTRCSALVAHPIKLSIWRCWANPVYTGRDASRLCSKAVVSTSCEHHKFASFFLNIFSLKLLIQIQ